MNRRFFLRALGAGGVAALGASMGAARAGTRTTAIRPGSDSVLIVVDTQNCFTAGGTLAVKDGDQVVPVINRLGKAFENVVMTQDWHPRGHISFASSHPGKKPYDTVRVPYGEQVLWPDHCVQGTEDADLRKDLDVPQAQLIIRKGYHKEIDSYSAFMEADRRTATGLAPYLHTHHIRKVFVVGLATDFCVASTAIDARAAGFDVYVIEDATRAVDLNGSLAQAWADMEHAGVKRIRSDDIVVPA